MCSFSLHSIHILHTDIGNHESVNMNQMYGFEGEVKAKYPLLKYTAHTYDDGDSTLYIQSIYKVLFI